MEKFAAQNPVTFHLGAFKNAADPLDTSLVEMSPEMAAIIDTTDPDYYDVLGVPTRISNEIIGPVMVAYDLNGVAKVTTHLNV